jgi:hypothetical protein
MSWIDKIQNSFTITTGDGLNYTPNWLNAQKEISWNVAEFDFENIDGTLVKRSRPRGNRYNFELYFQGENHLDVSDAFEISAKDNRPWIVAHPLYGQLNIQPVSMSFNNSDYNVTKITGSFVETILEEYPGQSNDPVDEIATLKGNNDETFVNSLDSTPTAGDVNSLKNDNERLYKQGAKVVNDKTLSEEYFNAFNKANSAILVGTAAPLQAMRQVQAMINLPSQFKVSVQNRIQLFSDQFQGLRRSLDTITRPSTKKIYQINAGAVVGAMCVASSLPQSGDYTNRSSVLSIITTVISVYNQYILDLDGFQTDNNGDMESFIPDYYSHKELNYLVNFTVSNLFGIALGTKQERTFVCPEETDLITVTHRLLGLDPEDKNIDEIINLNTIGLNEILSIRKGREIVYLV